MGVIAKDNNQITLYFNSKTSVGEQTLAYVEAAEKKLRIIDISETKVTGTQWSELADGLGLSISDMVNTEHPAFQKEYGSEEPKLDHNGWVKVLQKNPEVLSAPIAIIGDTFVRVNNPSDLEKHLGSDGNTNQNRV